MIISQSSLFIAVIICAILMPQGLAANNGISFFGAHLRTVFPYLIGLLTSAYFCVRAGRVLPFKYPFSTIKVALYSLALLIVGIVSTPYDANPFVSRAHDVVGITLFLIQFGISFWVALVIYRNLLNVTFFILELVGGVMALIYLEPAQGFLLQGQIIFELFFSILVTRYVIDKFSKLKKAS